MTSIIRRRDLFRAAAAGAAAITATASDRGLPLAPFGANQISRLIVGGNPISANSHVSPGLDDEMRDYFTAAAIKKLLAECEQSGINTWQSRGDRHIMRLLHEYRLEGGKIQWIAQTASEYGDLRRNLSEISRLKPIGIYHHGAQTDKYWNENRIEQANEGLKAIRQTGARVGLGTHIPEVIDYAEAKGWDLDFYMACVYNLGRTREEAARVAGRPVAGELFWDADREKMLARVKRVSKTCLIFKIYGATRQCATPEARKAAVDLAFEYAKPGDAVVVGMFPKYSEQVKENCRLVAGSIARFGI
jgi:hypothetical protein